MKVVGIKQLKARLSEYLRLAKAGETVLVTERDEVVAELRPARRRAPIAERARGTPGGARRGRRDQPGRPAEGRLGLAEPRSRAARRHRADVARRAAPGALLNGVMASAAALYLDTSVALRATLESGHDAGDRAADRRRTGARDLAPRTGRIGACPAPGPAPGRRARAPARRRAARAGWLWNRCELWELSPAVCDLAALLAPEQAAAHAGCAASGDLRPGAAADRRARAAHRGPTPRGGCGLGMMRRLVDPCRGSRSGAHNAGDAHGAKALGSACRGVVAGVGFEPTTFRL